MASRGTSQLASGLTVVCVGFCLCQLGGCTGPLDPEEMFARYIQNPIPSSVANIKVSGHAFMGYSYKFKFDISRSDLDAIVASHSLERMRSASCSSRGIDWELPSGKLAGGATWFADSDVRPKWFAPEEWEEPEVYVLDQATQPRLQILLYDETLGQAYFIVRGS